MQPVPPRGSAARGPCERCPAVLSIVSSRLGSVGAWVATAGHELCRPYQPCEPSWACGHSRCSRAVPRVFYRCSWCHHAAVRPVGGVSVALQCCPSSAVVWEAWVRGWPRQGMSFAGRISHASAHSCCSRAVTRVFYRCSRCHHAAVRPVGRVSDALQGTVKAEARDFQRTTERGFCDIHVRGELYPTVQVCGTRPGRGAVSRPLVLVRLLCA